jgi:quercetin dioxygenase-like cupin family protein
MPEDSTYFRHGDADGESGAGRFMSVDPDVPEVEAAPGVWMRPVFGENLNLSLVRMEPHAVAAVHEHSEEQMGFVLDGSCEFTLADDKRTLNPGDAYVAPAFLPHGAEAGDEGCRILDAFSPPREALRQLFEDRQRS